MSARSGPQDADSLDASLTALLGEAGYSRPMVGDLLELRDVAKSTVLRLEQLIDGQVEREQLSDVLFQIENSLVSTLPAIRKDLVPELRKVWRELRRSKGELKGEKESD